MTRSSRSVAGKLACSCLAAWAVASCVGDTDPRPVTVRDSVGIEIIEHPAAMGGLSTWTLQDPPEAVIGREAEQETAHQFTRVQGAVRLSDGRIVVGDWGTKEARYFDSDGRHLHTVGGGGPGPGEVRFLFAVDRLPGDTMVVGGWPIGSRYWFDEDGSYVRDQSLGPWFPGMLGRTLPDGSLIIDTFEAGSYGNTIETWAMSGPDDDIRPRGVIERVARDGSRIDTIGPILGERHHKTGEPRVNFASHALPFSPIGLVAWSADRIFVGHTERPEIRVHAYSGRLERIIRWEGAQAEVDEIDRRTFEEDLFADLGQPHREPDYRRWLLEVDFPERKPFFTQMLADESGYLWVRPSVSGGEDHAEWMVFGPDGRAVATVSVPAHRSALDVDATHLLATWTDDLDVAFVGAHRVERPPRSSED